MNSRIVLAIGGNSLIRAKDKQSFSDQLAAVGDTCHQVADLVEAGHEVVITHGNGPQVGFLLIRSHLSRNRLPETPLDAANAQTQAEIGYMIQQALGNELSRRGLYQTQKAKSQGSGVEAQSPARVNGVVTVVTQVVVDPNDPAFQNPSKPVGPFYTKAEAAALQRELGWTMREDAGRGFRRFVPSPRPVEIVELPEIRRLLESGFVVIACGGGGIPVVSERTTQSSVVRSQNAECGKPESEGWRQVMDSRLLRGVAAVIDKDLASSLLARELGADIFVISTAVEQVYLDYGKPNQRPLGSVKAKEMREYLLAGQFPDGSMGPKVEAALSFLGLDEFRTQEAERRMQELGAERQVIITDPEHIVAALRGEAGTRITA
ncbi:MAG: carbamate kinase [candidate division WOR-3 bacterium]